MKSPSHAQYAPRMEALDAQPQEPWHRLREVQRELLALTDMGMMEVVVTPITDFDPMFGEPLSWQYTIAIGDAEGLGMVDTGPHDNLAQAIEDALSTLRQWQSDQEV